MRLSAVMWEGGHGIEIAIRRTATGFHVGRAHSVSADLCQHVVVIGDAGIDSLASLIPSKQLDRVSADFHATALVHFQRVRGSVGRIQKRDVTARGSVADDDHTAALGFFATVKVPAVTPVERVRSGAAGMAVTRPV